MVRLLEEYREKGEIEQAIIDDRYHIKNLNISTDIAHIVKVCK